MRKRVHHVWYSITLNSEYVVFIYFIKYKVQRYTSYVVGAMKSKNKISTAYAHEVPYYGVYFTFSVHVLYAYANAGERDLKRSS